MITNYNNKNRKDDIKALCLLISVFLLIAWFCSPPGNKFAQVCLYGNKTQYFIAKMTKPKSELEEWKFHRNNAVFLAQMERKNLSLKEMDEAIKVMPTYFSDYEAESLYADRGSLRLYWKEYKRALDDFLRIKDPDFNEKFKIALLYKKAGNNRYALSYCNSILNTDPSAYIGYACIADIYSGVGKHEVAVRVFDLLIDKVQNRPQFYVDRAIYKKLAGDIKGYELDMKHARELLPTIKEESKIISDAIEPKRLDLSIL